MSSRTIGHGKTTGFVCSFQSAYYKVHRTLFFDFVVAESLAPRWISKVVVVFE